MGGGLAHIYHVRLEKPHKKSPEDDYLLKDHLVTQLMAGAAGNTIAEEIKKYSENRLPFTIWTVSANS